jgi:Arc/MetJ-type ribon-helix-helix transcriptional regulator
MGKQLTVRLPDALVEFIDQQVEHGEASSRAAVVAAALDQQRRREIGERDAAILARAAADGDDLDDLAAFAAQTPLGDLA